MFPWIRGFVWKQPSRKGNLNGCVDCLTIFEEDRYFCLMVEEFVSLKKRCSVCNESASRVDEEKG